MTAKKRILFVCVENSCRSQMAEAFGRLHGDERFEVSSAGSRPSGVVNPKAIEAMSEIGYDLTAHVPKSLDDIPDETYDFVATMGCGDECPYITASRREDWSIPDPKNMAPDEFRTVRDEIGEKVRVLIDQLSEKS